MESSSFTLKHKDMKVILIDGKDREVFCWSHSKGTSLSSIHMNFPRPLNYTATCRWVNPLFHPTRTSSKCPSSSGLPLSVSQSLIVETYVTAVFVAIVVRQTQLFRVLLRGPGTVYSCYRSESPDSHFSGWRADSGWLIDSNLILVRKK